MDKRDLQVGDTWTAVERQGLGLATLALNQIADSHLSPTCRLWYIVGEGNTASLRVAKKAGFKKVGEGTRTAFAGMKLFGRFILEERNDGS